MRSPHERTTAAAKLSIQERRALGGANGGRQLQGQRIQATTIVRIHQLQPIHKLDRSHQPGRAVEASFIAGLDPTACRYAGDGVKRPGLFLLRVEYSGEVLSNCAMGADLARMPHSLVAVRLMRVSRPA